MTRRNRTLVATLWICLATGAGCDGNKPESPGSPVHPGVSPNGDEYAATKAALAADTPKDAAALLERWRPNYLATLPYAPAQATNLALLQASPLKLDDAELAKLGQAGLVVSGRQTFASFFMGYTALYENHLPLFVSGDSVLHAVHRSYDKILMSLEQAALSAALQSMLTKMRMALAQEQADGAWPPETVVDVDEYLAVAYALAIREGTVAPVAGGDLAAVTSLVGKAKAASGTSSVVLFGDARDVDFSQFKPRGHYAGNSILEPYFRATMWLGRVDLRLLSQGAGGGVSFHRRQFAAALLMAKLAQAAQDEWTRLDRTLRAMVGESDNMTAADFPRLQQQQGADSLPALLAKTDDELAQAIVQGGFGIQRIASQLLFVTPGNEGAPLDRAFLLLGQRFVIDSQVLSNVVYDRVPTKTKPYRMMPNPLDVAFAALGNAGAAPLLASELGAYPGYPQALHQARALVDMHEGSYWTDSLYGGWLGALRAASPVWNGASAPSQPLLATEAWTRRILQMQLASWAELRHDTILYAKPSYTSIPACEFPDAYVEPIPVFWQALVDFARRGSALVAELATGQTYVANGTNYFASLERTMTMLLAMAAAQERGEPFTAEQLAFINQAVEYKSESVVCTTIVRPTGWYPQLFFDPDSSDEQDTIIADVHTQPADQDGNPVGKVLHVGTGFPRLMAVAFNTCSGPRVYTGLGAAYHETITSDFQRLTDADWTSMIEATPPADAPWISDLVAR